MNRTLAVIAISLFTILCSLEAATSPDGLAASVRSAIVANDQSALSSLIYTEGMSEADKQLAERSQKSLLSDREIDEVALVPLPPDFQSVAVVRGKKIETTAPPKGIIQIKFKSQNGGSFSSSLPYAEVDGHYFLVGTKSTDLNWTGPPDKQIGYGVSGKGQDSVTVEVKWNASGVNQEQILSAPSAILLGQYFEKISVTTENEESELILTVREDGKEIFRSLPLKGKGTLTYKKQS